MKSFEDGPFLPFLMGLGLVTPLDFVMVSLVLGGFVTFVFDMFPTGFSVYRSKYICEVIFLENIKNLYSPELHCLIVIYLGDASLNIRARIL